MSQEDPEKDNGEFLQINAGDYLNDNKRFDECVEKTNKILNMRSPRRSRLHLMELAACFAGFVPLPILTSIDWAKEAILGYFKTKAGTKLAEAEAQRTKEQSEADKKLKESKAKLVDAQAAAILTEAKIKESAAMREHFQYFKDKGIDFIPIIRSDGTIEVIFTKDRSKAEE